MKLKAEIVSAPDFKKVEKRITNTFDTNFIKLTKLGAQYLRSIIPYKTGAMRRSINYDTHSIWSTSDKYKYVDEGTKPHRIEGLLAFKINGVTIFSKGVDHPGTKAQHLTDRTMIKINENIPVLVKEINRAIA